MDVRVGLWRRLSAEECMLLNCGVGEDSWESLGQQGDQTSQSFFSPPLIIYLFILLYNIVLVLPYIDFNLPSVYMFSPSWMPLPPPSPSHPSGSSQCTSTEHPLSCIEPGLAIHFTYDNYMFQCHSPISSLPCPLPQRPKDSSIHLCVFCCLAYRVIVSIFLNSLYTR